MFCFLRPGRDDNQMTFVLVDSRSSHYFSYHTLLGKPSLSPFSLISFYFQLIKLPFLDLKFRQVSAADTQWRNVFLLHQFTAILKIVHILLCFFESGLAPSILSQWFSAFQ